MLYFILVFLSLSFSSCLACSAYLTLHLEGVALVPILADSLPTIIKFMQLQDCIAKDFTETNKGLYKGQSYQLD